MKKTRPVSPMGRLIARAEFEKRLADYSTQLLKTMKRLTDHMAAQDARIAALEQRLSEQSAEVSV